MPLTVAEVKADISQLQGYWGERRKKFKEWMGLLTLEDKLEKQGLESFVSNDPRTNYNMAHFLLTTGVIRHSIPIVGDNPMELDKQARVERGVQYMWRMADEDRRRGGNPEFVSELGFHLLVLGWYSIVAAYDSETGRLIPRLWSPANTFPRYDDYELSAVVHEYKLSVQAAKRKAAANGWNYRTHLNIGQVTLDNYFYFDEMGRLLNMILIDKEAVTDWVVRDELLLLVSPVGGFPERGEITGLNRWRGMVGQSFLETNRITDDQWNKLFTFQMQLVRDTANPVSQEISAGSPKVRPAQLTERGAHFHFAPGDSGLSYVAKPPIPLELQAMLADMRREKQKGGFSDAVFGMVEQGMSGLAYSALAESSASQVLNPYMEAKHFILSELDKFWLRKLKSQGRTFSIKGKMLEKMKSSDIPEDAEVTVGSELATAQDWLEKATIANMVKDQLDDTTILNKIYRVDDTQDIKRRRRLDSVTEHPVAKAVEVIAAMRVHADYLDARGGSEMEADLYRKAADSLEMQLGVPEPGQAAVPKQEEAERKREEGAPEKKTEVPTRVSPPEALRAGIGKMRKG